MAFWAPGPGATRRGPTEHAPPGHGPLEHGAWKHGARKHGARKHGAVTMMQTTPGGVPVSAVDPFGDDFLADPFRWHGGLRDAGPVVWLERYGVWAMARYAEVHDALRDWATFCSSAGVGLSDFRRETPWRPPSLLLEADPPGHSRARTAVARALTPRTVRSLRDDFTRAATRLAADLAGQGTVDGVPDIAEAFPLRVFAEAVGLAEPGGEQLLAYGNMAFNAFGPRNELTRASLRQAAEVGAWIAAQCTRDALTPGGLGARIYASVDDGTISADEAALLVRSLLTAGVDTTVIGLGCALDCLARDPSQWQLLREDPTRAGAAFEESLRYASPVQTFFRTTTRDVTVGGVPIGAGEKVLLFLAAANRDPRHWDDPDRFDLRRRAQGHVAFGFGIHACIGAALARLEGEVLLEALARQVGRLELAGQPRRRLNNTLSGFAALPLRLFPAGIGPPGVAAAG
jgi:cytochrome P450